MTNHANEAEHRLIVLGCIIASIVALAGLIAWLGLAAGIGVGVLIAVGLIGTYLLVIGPWQRRWGATDDEIQRAMPGDGLLRPDAPSTTRAITIDASPETSSRGCCRSGTDGAAGTATTGSTTTGSRAWCGSIPRCSG